MCDILNIYKYATKLAQSVKGRHKMAALIFDKSGRLLSSGVNNYSKTHPIQALFADKAGQANRKFLHAEIQAIIRLPYNSRAHKIFVIRVNKDGKFLLAKPCPACELAISKIGIKIVEYTMEE